MRKNIPARIDFAGFARVGLVAFILIAATESLAANDQFKVVSGQMIVLNGERHVLYGIFVPEPGEQCRLRGALRDCGRLSRSALLDLTAGARVTCTRAPAGQRGSKCFSDGYDISEGMVYTGWAEARADAPSRFSALMAQAKERRRGLWHDSSLATVLRPPAD